MISDLQALHEATEEHFRRLADALAAERPCTQTVAAARWRLSSTVRGRRELIQRAILPRLTDCATAIDRLKLDALADADAETSAQLSAHIALWTIDKVEADWSRYKIASQQLRETMRQQMRSEAQTLFPLLDRVLAAPAPRQPAFARAR